MNGKNRNLFLDGLTQIYICDTKFTYNIMLYLQSFLEVCNVYWQDT